MQCENMSHTDRCQFILNTARPGFSGVQQAIAAAAYCDRKEHAQSNSKMMQAADILSRHESGAGQSCLTEVLQLLPGLSGFSLRPVPHNDGALCCEVHIDQTQQAAIASTSWANSHSHLPLASSMERCWNTLHSTIHGSLSPIRTQQSRKSACFHAGRCLCSGEGRLLQRLRNAILVCMKEQFKLAASKILLSEACIVMHFISSHLDNPDEATHIYFHVGLHYSSPYRPSLHRLVAVPIPADEPPSPAACVFLKASHTISISLPVLISYTPTFSHVLAVRGFPNSAKEL